MGPENNVGLWSASYHTYVVTVPHVMVGLERMLEYRGVRLERFHCNIIRIYVIYDISCIITIHIIDIITYNFGKFLVKHNNILYSGEYKYILICIKIIVI